MRKNQWELKRNRARLVEREILKWVRENLDKEARLVEGYFPDYDIYTKKGCIEVKEDRLAHQTGNYALEFETHDGKPSGYQQTTADMFVIVDWEHVSLMATDILKDIVDSTDKKEIDMGEVFGDKRRNRGYLIPRERILNNPLVSVYRRWFPVYNG